MRIDELEEAKDKLAKDAIALAKDFETLTSVRVRELYVNIPPPIDTSPEALEENKYRANRFPEPSCTIDLNM